MKKALITGITGQDGSYLAELLLKKGYEVHGIVRRVALEDPEHRLWRIRHILDKIKLHSASLESYASIFNVIEAVKPQECYHLAAQSFVSYSFEDEFSTINTNINGTMHVLSAIKQKAPECRFYFAGCYSDDTRIVTRDGFKKYDETKIGDKIYTVNVKTNQIELNPVKRIIVKKYKGTMIHIKGKRIDLLVTPDHNMLLQKGNKLFYEKAQNIKKMVYDRASELGFPTPRWKGVHKKHINFLDFVSINSIPYNTNKNLITKMEAKDYLYLLGIYIGDGYTGKYKYRRTMSAYDFIKRRNNKGQFISSDKGFETIIYPSNYIFFAIPEKDKARKKIINILKKYKIEFRAKMATIEFSSAILQKMFKQSGNNKYEKHIPQWALELSSTLLYFLYDGLIDSDGCHKKDGRDEFTTTSKRLMEGFIELCIKLQFIPKVFYKKASKIYFRKEKRFFNSKKHYRISINHGFRKKIYKKHLVEKKYNGIVWCLEMKDNHNFIIERKGDFYFCGNSSEMFGKAKESPQNEETPFHPRSPYGISKVAGFDLTRNYREAYGLFALSGILFNHESSRRGFEFVSRKISNGVAEIKLGISKKLPLGNLQAKRDWGFAGDYCIDLDTSILTIEGFKYYDEIKAGDIILNYNTKTDRLEQDRIIKKILLNNKEKMYIFKGRGFKIRCSVNHRIYYQRKSKTSKGGWSGWKVCEAKNFYKMIKDLRLRTKYDFRLPHTQGYKNKNLKIKNEWFKLIGYLLSEGNLYDGNRNLRISLSQSKIVNKKVYKDIKSILKNLNLVYRIRERTDGVVEFTFKSSSSRQIISYFDSFDVHRMPRWIYKSGDKQLKLLLNAMMDGDGSWGAMTYVSKRKDLISDFQAIATILGYRTIVNQRKSGIWECVLIALRKKYAYITDCMEEKSNEKIWCVTTKNGTIVTNKDDGIAVTGNCEAMFLMLQQDEPEDYVIATGETHSVKEFAEIAFKHAGLNWKDYVVVDKDLYRPAEVNILMGDYARAKKKLGWEPKVKFEELVRMMVEADLQRLKKGRAG